VTSAPPPASSWAAPPEFYIDANITGRTVRNVVRDLGYTVHTPRSVFGGQRLERGLDDVDWLPVVGARGWVVIGRDQHILDREVELRAYLAARVHMFLLPGEATRQQLVDLVSSNLLQICTLAAARRSNVYWLTRGGVIPYERRAAERTRRRRRRRQ
jgi:PIN like domain